MLKLFKSEKVQKVNISMLAPVLRGYECQVSPESVKVVKRYVINGQEMNRVFIKESKTGLQIVDGWGARIMETTKERLLGDLKRVFDGEFSGGIHWSPSEKLN